MHLATEWMFLFKDELFKQVDGIGMGSPLACTMANCLVTLNYIFAILMMCLLFLMVLTRVRLF